MTKRRGLIMYASVTGNTEKVAKAFAKAMEQNDWEAVLYKIDAKPTFTTTPCISTNLTWLPLARLIWPDSHLPMCNAASAW